MENCVSIQIVLAEVKNSKYVLIFKPSCQKITVQVTFDKNKTHPAVAVFDYI